MENSKIEWTDHTFNAWTGCTKVSPACDHCYAEAWAKRSGIVEWGAHAERRRTSEAYWRQPLKWNRDAAKAGVRRKVFCCSLADVFDNKASQEWRDDLWALIAATPNLDWLLLTKRPQNIAKMLPDMPPWPNVWLGTTVENQEEADRRIPHLIAVPAAVRFLSCEPLLESVNLLRLSGFGDSLNWLTGEMSTPFAKKTTARIDWVICGGESGPGARPMHPDWARILRDQCVAAGVPFFFKQWGEWTPGVNVERHHGIVKTAEWFDGQWILGTEDLARDDGHIDDEPDLYRVGKKHAGAALDGREWREFPTPGA